ncbi:MAG: RNA polymerase sigma factor [Planctomycetota bacterium]
MPHPDSPETRLSLIDELRSSDPATDAWREFVEVYESWIARWLERQGVAAADADDIRQEVLMVVLRRISSFEHNGKTGAFRSWLRKITVNRTRRVWQRKRQEQRRVSPVDLSNLADELADDSSRLTAIWDEEHDRFVVARLFESLRKEFRSDHLQAVRELIVSQEPVEQVSKRFSLSIGAVRVAQHRIFSRLRQRVLQLVDL